MTTKHSAAGSEMSVSDLDLESLYLYDCKIERGEHSSGKAGAVRGTFTLEPSVSSDDLTYKVECTYTFCNDNDDLMATVKVTYVAVYGGGDVTTLPESEIDRFAKSVIVQVTPFAREFMATMMNRMALPNFLLPLVRRRDITMTDADSDPT